MGQLYPAFDGNDRYCYASTKRSLTSEPSALVTIKIIEWPSEGSICFHQCGVLAQDSFLTTLMRLYVYANRHEEKPLTYLEDLFANRTCQQQRWLSLGLGDVVHFCEVMGTLIRDHRHNVDLRIERGTSELLRPYCGRQKMPRAHSYSDI